MPAAAWSSSQGRICHPKVTVTIVYRAALRAHAWRMLFAGDSTVFP